MATLHFRQLRFYFFVAFCLNAFVNIQTRSGEAVAQGVAAPDRREIFEEDRKNADSREQDRKRRILGNFLPEAQSELQINAPQIEILKDSGKLKGSGGVVVSDGPLQIQAESAIVDTKSKVAELPEGVLLTSPDGTLEASSGSFAFESETGEFKNAKISADVEGYYLEAAEAEKLSEFEYELSDSTLTTCQCADGSKPWQFASRRSHITQEGYAHCYGSVLKLGGVPTLYLPYVGVPVKTKRASGLLPVRFGLGNRDGFQLYAPIFSVVDGSTDFTFTPFIETKTRAGIGLEFRKDISRDHKLRSKFIYSNESIRDGALRGTVTQGLFDPTFDDNRFGAYISDVWRGEFSEGNSFTFVSDVHYVSDDLLARELEDDQILRRDSQFAISRLAFRSGLGSIGSFELSSEYNQSLLTDDDLVFQRLPEATVNLYQSFRPFGMNPYGLKLVTKAKLNATNFTRSDGYDGWRYAAVPTVQVPFHFKNYFDSTAEVSFSETAYRLSDNKVPGTTDELDDNGNRAISRFSFRVGTGVERVFDVNPNSALGEVVVGADDGGDRLTRVKHTIEPAVNFIYVPDEDQDGLPIFDSFDRIRQRKLVTYGVTSSLYGKIEQGGQGLSDVEEITPSVSDIAPLDLQDPNSPFGDTDMQIVAPRYLKSRSSEIRELARMQLRQSYDLNDTEGDNVDALSDIGANLDLFPRKNIGMRLESNYNAGDGSFTSMGVGASYSARRGDALRLRYSFLDEQVKQIEGNIEAVLTERLRLGYYARYDERQSQFVESRAALRFKSSCNCWHVDLGYTDRINPDRQQVLLSFGLGGIGAIGQRMGFGN
jgi:LPS-assembly protein